MTTKTFCKSQYHPVDRAKKIVYLDAFPTQWRLWEKFPDHEAIHGLVLKKQWPALKKEGFELQRRTPHKPKGGARPNSGIVPKDFPPRRKIKVTIEAHEQLAAYTARLNEGVEQVVYQWQAASDLILSGRKTPIRGYLREPEIKGAMIVITEKAWEHASNLALVMGSKASFAVTPYTVISAIFLQEQSETSKPKKSKR
jgi:hypothetical protein